MRLFLIFSLMILASKISAEESSGCGVGWKVTKSMTTTASSTRSSTNATFSNTIGMTLGTSGCDKHSIVINDKQKIHFLESNLEEIKLDLAMGSGEKGQALALLFGCENHYANSLINVLRKQDFIYNSEQNAAAKVADQIQNVIATNSILARHCRSDS